MTSDPARPAAIWSCDRGGTLVLLSGAGLPWAPSVEVGAAVEALVPARCRPRMSALVRAALDGAPGGLEVAHAEGRWVVRAEPSSDGASGTITRAPTPDLDRERYRLLVERSPFGIQQIDERGHVTSTNAAGLAVMGVADEASVRGAPFLELVCERDRGRVAQRLAAAFDGVPSQLALEAKSGASLDATLVPLVEDGGRVSTVMALTHDVTQRARGARALAESEHRLDMALRAAELGLWVWDAVEDRLRCNERRAEILGEALEDVAMSLESLSSRMHPEDRDEAMRRLRAHLRGETELFDSEYRLRTKSGEWRWVHDRGRVMERDDAGEPLRMFGVTQDVTERVGAAARQEELQAQLVQAQKMESVGQLAGGIAHDFNNLLTVILGNLEMALEDVGEAGLDTADLEETRAAAERASSLTRRLLTFSRQRTLEKSPTDLNAVVEGLGQMLERVLPESITLELALDPALPRVDADPGQIEQVLLNLCVNARDATPGDGTLRIETRARDGMAELTVRDDGTGMSEETRRRALEPFYTTKEPQGGTGLGLAMVYGIVTQHGGELLLDSALGRGTRVAMCFPALDEAAQSRPPPPSGEEKTRRGTVLVIEDESHVRKLMCRTLTRGGYEVLQAVDGVEGVELFEAHADEIELVIVDAIMPRMDGRETAKRILARRPDVRLLFSTGYHAGGFGDLAPEHRLLSKPYTPRVLLDTVEQVLDAASATP